MNVPPVVVVGAGLGGLTLASILIRHGAEVTVVDADAGPDARPQGGMLDMHEDSGQAALRAAGLYDAFRAEVLPGAEAMRVVDMHGVLRHEDAGDGGRPEVPRAALRRLLLGSLPDGTVQWGRKVTGARPGGGYELTFADGGSLAAPLLVGADGAWSRIRPLVSDATPVYSGISFATTRLYDADARHPQAAAIVGAGLLFALGEERGFLAHREPGSDLEVYVAARTEQMPDTAEALLEHFAGWDEGLRDLIRRADDPFVVRPIHALPVGHRWERSPGVTLLGDAAHLMSPFAGEGANLALRDAADLAAALLAHGPDVEDALAGYEATMFPRAEAAAAESAANLEVSFGPDALQGLLDAMAAHAA